MKILDLPLKSVWYLMIESGEKLEEYREIKPYWVKRLKSCYDRNTDCRIYIPECKFCYKGVETNYTHIRFRYGYTKRTMLFNLDGIYIGKGNPDWGAPDEKVFILKLGERLKVNEYDNA